MAGFSRQVEGVVAIDGKVLRRSFDRASGKSPLHMVSAWGCEQRMVLAQIATDAKSNEITAVPKLLDMLSLKGTIVTTDALNCQREIARKIIDKGGDYALALKGNQGTLHDEVRRFLDDPKCGASVSEPMVEGDHGRIETRMTMISTDIGWLQDNHDWPGLAAIGKVVRSREAAGTTTTETAYYLLSTVLSAQRLNEVVRSHWGIENRLHWRLDVVMNEDQARTDWGTAHKTSPFCNTWRSTSCKRTQPRGPCEASLNAPDGTRPTSLASSIYSEMRLPCCFTGLRSFGGATSVGHSCFMGVLLC